MSDIRCLLGDCLELLPEMELEKERTITITSPPYNMNLRVRGSNTYVSRGFENSSSELIATKYKNYRDDLPMEVYYELQKKFLTLAIEKSNLVFYNIQMITGNKQALFKLMGDFYNKIKEVIIWDKTWGQPAVKDGCLNSRFEFILILSDLTPTRRRFEFANFKRGSLDNLWQIKPGKHKGMKAGWPDELIQKLITEFVPNGFTVLDPYMGSGTAGKICKNLGYSFIGIERDEETYNMALNKIYGELE